MQIKKTSNGGFTTVVRKAYARKVQSSKKKRRIFEEIAPSKLNGMIKITKIICPPLVEDHEHS